METARAIGFTAAATAIVSAFAGGLDFHLRSGTGGTHITAALSPIATLLWLPAAATVALSWRLARSEPSSEQAPWYRVLIALFVDAGVHMTFVFVPLCVSALLLESSHTSQVAWQFSRDFGRPSDSILWVLFLVGGVAFWSSFGVPFVTGRGSPGSLAAGVVLESKREQPLWRTAVFGVFAYFGLAIPPFKFFAALVGFDASAWERAA